MATILMIDTSNKFLSVGIVKDDKLVYKLQYQAWQRQSEFTMVEVQKALQSTNITAQELTRIVVSKGPGSYTGLRIALTIGKVMAYALHIPLKAFSSLQVLAGKSQNALVLMDARSGRAFVGHYDRGQQVEQDCVMTLASIQEKLINDKSLVVVGDGSLIGLQDSEIDIVQNMFDLLNEGEWETDVNMVQPQYLK